MFSGSGMSDLVKPSIHPEFPREDNYQVIPVIYKNYKYGSKFNMYRYLKSFLHFTNVNTIRTIDI